MLSRFSNQILMEGILGGALMAIIGLFGLFVPVLALVSNLFAPLPLVVLIRRRDLKTGVLALLVAAILMFLACGFAPLAITVVLQAGSLGLLLGLLFKNHVSSGKSIVLSVFTAAVVTLISLGLVFLITGVNLFVMGPDTRQTMEQMLDWYTRLGLVQQPLSQEARQVFDNTLELIGQLIPANFIIWSMITAFLTYILAGQSLIRLKFSIPSVIPFTHWQFPWFLIWSVIAGLGLMLSGDLSGIQVAGTAGIIGKNILYISMFLYSLSGLSVCVYFVFKWNISRFLRYFLILLSLFYTPLAMFIIIVLGLVDSFVNLRKISGPAGGIPRGGI